MGFTTVVPGTTPVAPVTTRGACRAAPSESGGTAFVQHFPGRATEDVRLRGGGNAAGGEHLLIAPERQVELGKIASKAIRGEHQLFKSAGA